MSYTKNIWETRSQITKQKLENIEDGIFNFDKEFSTLTNLINFKRLFLNQENNETFLEISYNQLIEMLNNNKIPFFIDQYNQEGNYEEKKFFYFSGHNYEQITSTYFVNFKSLLSEQKVFFALSDDENFKLVDEK